MFLKGREKNIPAYLKYHTLDYQYYRCFIWFYYLHVETFMNVRPLVCISDSSLSLFKAHQRPVSDSLSVNPAQGTILKLPVLYYCLKAAHWGGDEVERTVIEKVIFYFLFQWFTRMTV